MRAIDADALKEQIKNGLGIKSFENLLPAEKYIVEKIDSMSTIQHKQRTARWERHYSRPNVYADLCWHCSACGYYNADNWTNKFKYCPNCGAKMTEGDAE